jgi:hypothetical protein
MQSWLTLKRVGQQTSVCLSSSYPPIIVFAILSTAIIT